MTGLVVAAFLAVAGPAAGQARGDTAVMPPLAAGDEPIFLTSHRIGTPKGELAYETRVGRLPIRNEQTGEVRAQIFFTAYVVKPKPGEKRPLTFVWNGGPMLPSTLLHFEAFGPRRRVGDTLVDNAETLLADSDLVFYDPPLTSFSRVAGEDPFEFYTLLGDVAATSEFIRAYRTKFRAMSQPLFIAGESYGVFRATGVADYLTERGVDLAGTLLISGDTPGISMPPAFYDAMHVQTRAATAYYHKRLPGDLMTDRGRTMAEVDRWAREVYWPALERKDRLSDDEREEIATTLARYTGLRPEQVDRKLLVVALSIYQKEFFGGDAAHGLNSLDTRQRGENNDLGSPVVVDRYYRDELGYNTSELYMPVYEHGYVPTPGPVTRHASYDFQYNQGSITPRVQAAAFATNEAAEIARRTPPWIEQSLRRQPHLRFFVATGRFDPRNMCEGDVIATAALGPGLSDRVTNRCYEGGHIMYRDEAERIRFLADTAAFIRETARARRN